jgi:hypothetical protein
MDPSIPRGKESRARSALRARLRIAIGYAMRGLEEEDPFSAYAAIRDLREEADKALRIAEQWKDELQGPRARPGR